MNLRLAFAALLLLDGAVVAAPRPRPRRPPPEAIDACSGRAAGDACDFTLGERKLEGVCRAAPGGDSGPLACVPDGPPPPPPEAIDACSGRSAGDACSVTLGDRSMEGVCRTGPDGNGPLACAPDAPPRQH